MVKKPVKLLNNEQVNGNLPQMSDPNCQKSLKFKLNFECLKVNILSSSMLNEAQVSSRTSNSNYMQNIKLTKIDC